MNGCIKALYILLFSSSRVDRLDWLTTSKNTFFFLLFVLLSDILFCLYPLFKCVLDSVYEGICSLWIERVGMVQKSEQAKGCMAESAGQVTIIWARHYKESACLQHPRWNTRLKHCMKVKHGKGHRDNCSVEPALSQLSAKLRRLKEKSEIYKDELNKTGEVTGHSFGVLGFFFPLWRSHSDNAVSLSNRVD